MIRILFPLIASAALCFGQLDSYSVTVTSSQNIYVPPDQAVFSIEVDAAADTGFDAVLSALSDSAIGVANLSDVSSFTTTGRTAQQMTAWTFALNVPIAAINSTVTNLNKLQTQIGAAGMSSTVTLEGSQVSPQLQAAQTCPTSALLANARTQALQLASLAGFGLGPVLAMSDGSVGTASTGTYYAVSGVLGISTTPVTCTMVVKFGLVGN